MSFFERYQDVISAVQLGRRATNDLLDQFAEMVKEIDKTIDFSVSSRGWAYMLEQYRLVNKDQFDRVANWINAARKKGKLPVDFVGGEAGRQFKGVEEPESRSPTQYIIDYLASVIACGDWYGIDWWEQEDTYIQVVVEKADLVGLFYPVCQQYHIPIANARGWQSILQRATYARRFAEAEENGLKCVLLYCGDHDPDGLRISDQLRKNLADVAEVEWSDGTAGYDPENLVIERFGLNYDFIVENNLTWIDNLITGSGKNLADPKHKNHFDPYVQEYLRTVGERKCEANALVPFPGPARQLMRDTIEKYLGDDALGRFEHYRDDLKEYMKAARAIAGIDSDKTEVVQRKLRGFGRYVPYEFEMWNDSVDEYKRRYAHLYEPEQEEDEDYDED